MLLAQLQASIVSASHFGPWQCWWSEEQTLLAQLQASVGAASHFALWQFWWWEEEMLLAQASVVAIGDEKKKRSYLCCSSPEHVGVEKKKRS